VCITISMNHYRFAEFVVAVAILIQLLIVVVVAVVS